MHTLHPITLYPGPSAARAFGVRAQVLKLSKEKFDDARDHAMRAVVADNRMRIWYVDKSNMEVGLLFTCRLGNADLERPVGEVFSPKPQHAAPAPSTCLNAYLF